VKVIREADRTPVQRNSFDEPSKAFADGHEQTINKAERRSGKFKVLEDNLARA
jgi:hypothetical protein